MKNSVMLLLSLLVGSAGCAEGQLRLTKSERMAEFRKAYPCQARAFPIEIMNRTSFKDDACTLVTLAMDRLARGEGTSFGMMPGDTSRIVLAAAMDNRDGTEREDGKWLVTLQVAGRPTSMTLLVDQQNGKVLVKEDHYLQPPPKRP